MRDPGRLEASDAFTLYGGVNNVGNVQPYRNQSAYPVPPFGRFFFLGVRLRGGLPF